MTASGGRLRGDQPLAALDDTEPRLAANRSGEVKGQLDRMKVYDNGTRNGIFSSFLIPECFAPRQPSCPALCLHLRASGVYLEAVACVNQRPVHSPVERRPFSDSAVEEKQPHRSPQRTSKTRPKDAAGSQPHEAKTKDKSDTRM